MTQKITNLNASNYTQEESFTQALLLDMEANGVPCKDPIQLDGKRHRYSRDEDPQGDEWYQIYSNYEGGRTYYVAVYGTFSGGKQTWKFHSWNTKREKPAFLAPLAATIEKDTEDASKEKLARLLGIWHSMTTEAPNRAARYLERKKVPNFEGRYSTRFFRTSASYEKKDTFVVPLRTIEGEIRALQSIAEDGSKRVDGQMKGHFHLIGTIKKDSPLYVAEGYATAASIHLATGSPTLMAVCCSNLEDSIEAVRSLYKEVPIVVAADNDKWKPEKGNPGKEYAEKAASKWNCTVALPSFPEDAPGEPTDWNDWHVLYGAESLKAELLKAKPPEKPLFSVEELKEAIQNEEVGDASLFLKRYGGDFLFDSRESLWYRWDGEKWTVDLDKGRYKALEQIALQYQRSAASQKDPKPFETAAKKLQTCRRMFSVMEMATPSYSSQFEWDYCPEKLPVPNGLIDLRTGELKERDRSDRFRKICPTPYKPGAKCPHFEAFLLQIMADRANLAAFLKRLFGYALLGNPREDRFVFLYGPLGRNGKGTLTRILAKILGHIARDFPAELLLLQKNPPSSGTARPDLIKLKGTRLALFSEINKGRKIDSALLKNLSGRDRIAARSLYSNETEEITPTHTIVMQSNYRPQAPADDTALWRRAIVVPFDITFVERPPSNEKERPLDTSLEAKLIEEAPGILNWLVEGAFEYCEYGSLLVPSEIEEASDEYRKSEDGIGAFLKECCEEKGGASAGSVRKSEFTSRLKQFCLDGGFSPPTSHEIAKYMRNNPKIGEFHDRRGDFWTGISLSSDS